MRRNRWLRHRLFLSHNSHRNSSHPRDLPTYMIAVLPISIPPSPPSWRHPHAGTSPCRCRSLATALTCIWIRKSSAPVDSAYLLFSSSKSKGNLEMGACWKRHVLPFALPGPDSQRIACFTATGVWCGVSLIRRLVVPPERKGKALSRSGIGGCCCHY
jgi:hypothetical protein